MADEISILHLSDIHFRRKDKEPHNIECRDVRSKMLAAIRAHLDKEKAAPDFVAVTGDIAFSGKKEEYGEAGEFFKELKSILPKETVFLVVPGNHDVDREETDPELFSLHSIVGTGKVDGFLEDPRRRNKHVHPKFKTFRAFARDLNTDFYPSGEDYFWVKNYDDKNVSFIGLNSCWACENDNDRGNITLGYPQVMSALKESHLPNRILLLHHPFDWLNEPDFKKYRGEIYKECRLILHGHSHSDLAMVMTYPSCSCIHLCANASYTINKEGFIGFQFIRASFAKEGAAVRVSPYRLDERDLKRFVPDTHRYEGQAGEYFDLKTFDRTHGEGDQRKSFPPLEIPESYREWVRAFHSTMDIDLLARKGEVITVSLPDVYIPIETRNPFFKEELEKKREDLPGSAEVEAKTKEPPSIHIGALVGRQNLILLRGHAGMGKTTLIKHLAYGLTHGTGPGVIDGYLPVMVFLKDLWPLYKNAPRDRHADITFETLLPAYLEKLCCPLSMEIITAYLARDRALFLIDGLDEVPDENRGALVDMVHRFQFQHNKNRFLITGRPHGIEGRAMHCFGGHLRDIEPLAGQRVGEFINRWFRVVSGQAQGLAKVNAADMISEINLHEHAAVFTGNPLLLTALCVFYLVGGKRVPDQRADLYDRIVANLLYRRFHDPADTDKVDKVQVYLMNLAFTMHTQNIKSIESYKAIDLLKQKEHYPILAGESPHDYKKRIEELFNGIEPVCGLLNRLSSGEIEFAHLTFQEFLAAKHLLDRGMDYKPYLKKTWWKETILLYLGLMNLNMKEPSNNIACEIIKNYSQPRIQLIGAKALQDFQATRREESAVHLAGEKLLAIIESGAKSPLEERFEAGEILGQLGDPRIDGLNPPMMPVNPDEFTRGSEEYDDEKPPRQIYLDRFMMGKYPVTNAEFKTFILDGGYDNKEYWTPEGWQWRQEENISEPGLWHDRKWNGLNFPVVAVSWYEASAYANWLTKKTGNRYCLPTEAQWEKAARGSRGFQYPWGDTFDKNKCNSRECGLGRTSPVGIFADGKSPYECMDMAGNVWEWCSDWYGENFYKESPKKNPKGPAVGSSRVLRGGGWGNDDWNCRAAYRYDYRPALRFVNVGFRLLRSL